jgi:predicted PurR-regulated permease PerM
MRDPTPACRALLEPVIRWLERRRFKRGLAVLMVGAVTLTTLGAFLFAAVAPLTSLFAAVWVLVSLTLLKVPAAFMLAVLAGVCAFGLVSG